MRIIRTLHERTGFVILDLVGSLNGEQDRDSLVVAIKDEIRAGRGKIILRLDDLTGIDACGVAAVMFWINRVVGPVRGTMLLSGARPAVRTSFETHRRRNMPPVRIFPNEATAIAQASPSPVAPPA